MVVFLLSSRRWCAQAERVGLGEIREQIDDGVAVARSLSLSSLDVQTSFVFGTLQQAQETHCSA